MCGIFGIVKAEKTPVAEQVLAGLKVLEYRGYDSWGVAVAVGEKIQVSKQIGKIGAAKVTDLPDSTVGLGHTRWATHGGVTQANAHPHLDCTGTVVVVHNGIITNYQSLKIELQTAGHQFKSETDSEVMAHLIEVELATGVLLPIAVRQAFLKLEGQNALVVFQADGQQLVAVRQGSPLVIGLGRDQQWLASDPAALVGQAERIIYLEDGELAVLSPQQVTISSVETGKKRPLRSEALNWTPQALDKGKFAHFMLKEIQEQPAILEQVAAVGGLALASVAEAIRQADQVFLLGCGSAGFAAAIGAHWLRTLAQIPVQAVVASEFDTVMPLVTAKTVILALSQSGETMDVLVPVTAAKAKGARLVAITNVIGSSLARLADLTVPLLAGPEQAVATTKAFTSKLAHLALLAELMSGQLETGQIAVRTASQEMAAMLTPENLAQAEIFAQSLKTAEHLYVIGRGTSGLLSAEVALKFKETAYLHAESLAAGELKHGTLALIEPGIPCLVLASETEVTASLSAAAEITARGGRVIWLGPTPEATTKIPGEVPFNFQPAGLLSGLPQLIAMQLTAYYLALIKKIDPDKPRNLAKSVTVG